VADFKVLAWNLHRIVGVSAEIQTLHLPNTKRKSCRQSRLARFIFVLLNPSVLLHVTYVPYYCPYTTNTTQTSMPLVGFFFPVRGFSPLIHFCTV
jgi:hypothetical protein